MPKQYLECGKIVSTHGVKGEVKVQPWCDAPEDLLGLPALYLDGGKNALAIEAGRVHKGMVLLRLGGISTPEEANRLRGRTLFLDRADLPLAEGQHFFQDLVGLRVLDADSGQAYGTLTNVFETGANDVYEVTFPDGAKKLVPAIADVVLDIDVDGGVMKILPLKGLFDDAD